MLNEFWSALKSGTDIRGTAVEGAGFDVNLTDDTVKAIVNAFTLWLSKKTGKTGPELKISVGRDSRISGPHMADLTKTELLRAGAFVVDCDLCSTPAMFMTTVELACDGAIQITASHHPFYKNGLKFFTREGGLEGDNITEILAYAQDSKKLPPAIGGHLVENAYMSYYAGNLREFIKEQINDKNDYHHPLKGFKIVVDAGNGVGGFYASEVLEALGADVRGSQFLEPDGLFPNHIPNPEDAKAMESVCAAVKACGADFGIIFDTDVDRCGAVDAQGKEINRNRLVALAAAIVLENNMGGMIVTASITSAGLKEFIEQTLGGKHLRFKRGYKNVIDEAIRQNENGVRCPLAIETSGHAAMQENYFLDDGAYLITKIIIKAAQLRKEGKTLDSLIADLKEPVESREIRLAITAKDFRAYGEQVIADLKAYAAKQKDFIVADDNYEGIRVSFDKDNGDGWFLLRLSVHDPIMPLNIESDSEGGVEKIYAKIKSFLDSCEGLSTSAPKAPAKAVKAKEVKPAVEAAPAEEVKPEATAEAVEDVKPEATAEVAEEVKPETTAEAAEEVKPETTAEVAEEVKPEATAEAVEEVKPEATAEAVEEAKPAAKAKTTRKTKAAKAAETTAAEDKTAEEEKPAPKTRKPRQKKAEAAEATEATEAPAKKTSRKTTKKK